tara:strand:+ start:123 stop:644 length:522 start_codon:yes stop_codon:yes gene_type:complete
MIHQMTDQEIADKIPDGYYRVDAGVRKEGDLILYADVKGDNFDPVKGLGAEIRHGAVIARPMLKPSNQYSTHSQDKAKTDDKGKPPLAKIPLALLNEVADVMEYGHAKYGDYNNFKKGMEISRNLSCALRHIYKFQNGEDLDQESTKSHLAHAATRLAFVLQNLKDGTAIDDR